MGSPRTLVHEAVFTVGLDSQTISDTITNGATFDRLNGVNPLHEFVALVDVGLRTTDGTYTVSLQESADDSAWTAVAAAEVVFGGAVLAAVPSGGLTDGTWAIADAADDNVQAVFGYLGSARYVRVAVTPTAQTTGQLTAVAVWYVGANPREMIDRLPGV